MRGEQRRFKAREMAPAWDQIVAQAATILDDAIGSPNLSLSLLRTLGLS
jgi:hypothetical protein